MLKEHHNKKERPWNHSVGKSQEKVQLIGSVDYFFVR